MEVPTVTPPANTASSIGGSGKKFIGYIHHFRGVAIIYVVAAHVLVQWPKGSVTSRILDLIFQNSTILFLFIAGYLFQHLSARFQYKDYLIKKFQNVICPYLIISAFVIGYRLIWQDVPGFTSSEHPDFYQWSKPAQAGYYLLHGAHLQQLWFIPMITIYYLLSPVLLYIDRHPKLYYVTLIPLILISMFIVHRSVLADTLNMGIHFLSVYLFGMFLSHYKDTYMAFARKWGWLITVLAMGVLVANYFVAPAWYDTFDYTQKMLFCCFYIYWLDRLDKYIPKFIDVLAMYSFGIYFVHYFFVLGLRAAYVHLFHQEVPGNMLTWTISLVIIMTGSLLSLKLAQKILGKKSKYVVGI
ncbi:Peptidoglycan/LPS O-acetylase OafA/YrhL, contains acyltransferase and SGNH-hydrolase domains [Chitinophaga costaii]|uniref:Peptidoglycan/LPS O-acetylase OafA/YrhL, contains acyltransferase and SGNH-hydrolase domains n=1 Tax=Chitinophaga costaii TaxID=1335309 RepID=A0A1C4FI06_9BACT|nr:acyltransferase [Chitinophaga costaii]PUZ20301.1 acyltransferase [Chitinophaga costaii]SCC55629.1 Peptidoglycan/LPS O-acetylase OafA/YrhL, contains acyltransferase and SGNH-hydrolase domains [Chitinophaga costaii]